MKKIINIFSILLVVLVLLQLSQMFMPYWNLTPVASRLNKDPQPTDYSIMQFCWTECEVMGKIFDDYFTKNFGRDTYVANDYVVALAMISVLSILSAVFSVITMINGIIGKKRPIIKVLTHVFSIWWAVLTLLTFMNNYLLTLGTYPMVWTIIFYSSIPAVAISVIRLVLDLIVGIKGYRAEYCA